MICLASSLESGRNFTALELNAHDTVVDGQIKFKKYKLIRSGIAKNVNFNATFLCFSVRVLAGTNAGCSKERIVHR